MSAYFLTISLSSSTNSSHSRPRLPGAVDYTYTKLLLHQLFSQPLKASGRSVLHLYKDSANPRSRVRLHSAFEVQLHTFAQFIPSHQTPAPPIASPSSTLPPSKAGTILGDCADSARDKDDVQAMRPRLRNFRWMRRSAGPVTSASQNSGKLTDFFRETRVPGAHGTNPAALACALEVALSIREEVVDLALKGGGADGRHLLKSAGSRGNEQGLTEVQNLSILRVWVREGRPPERQRMVEEVSGVLGQRFDAPEERKDCSAAVDPRVYDVGVGTDDERVLEDSGWWRRCPVFLGSGSTLPKNERIAARRWLIRPRIRPKSKLQDKCFERTAALDVENTMCRVNGIGSNAGAWDAADRGGTLSESLGTGFDAPQERIEAAGRRGGLCDSVTRRLLPAITITTHQRPRLQGSPTSPPPPAGGSAGYPHGNGGGVTPAAAVLAQTHAVLTPALADAIWHVARPPAVEKLVDEHPADFHLMDTSSPPSAANAAPTYVPSEEDVLRARAKSTAIIETRFLDGGFDSFPIHLLDVPPAPVSPSCEGTVYGAPTRGLRGTDALRVRATRYAYLFPLPKREARGGGFSAPALGPPAGLVHVHDWRVRACVRRCLGAGLYWRMATSTTEEEKTQMQCRQTRRFAPQNRMRGPLYLFESVINSLWFLRTSVILFLNKIDVFKRNIVSRPSSSPRATTSTSRALGAARAAATAPVTSAVGYSTPFSPPVRPARGRYLRD
ncbi:hypothetical protein B0H14DRAFT_2633898 [Mycena olivaceomarginata]|nr:hypothetical protein B0H14DRAFT_2633898 [Mycena olivaceomarginata]